MTLEGDHYLHVQCSRPPPQEDAERIQKLERRILGAAQFQAPSLGYASGASGVMSHIFRQTY